MGHFAYRTLAMCWAAEKQTSDVPDETHWPQTELDRFECVAQRLADAERTGIPAQGLDPMPNHGSVSSPSCGIVYRQSTTDVVGVVSDVVQVVDRDRRDGELAAVAA
jgi:hypothetical protein